MADVRWDLAHRAEGAVIAMYRTVLGRDPIPAESAVYIDNVLAQGGSMANIRVALATSSEAALDIEHIYQDMLGRSAGSDGVAGQEGGLIAGLSMAQIRHNVATSQEATLDIQTMFTVELRRAAGPYDLAFWEGALEAGSATFQSIRSAFAHSAEATGALVAVYQDVLLRAPTPDEIEFWETNALAQGATPEQVRYAVADSNGVAAIDAMYHKVLGRAVGATELTQYYAELKAGKSLGTIRQELADSQESRNNIAFIFLNEYDRPAQAPDYACWQWALGNGTWTLAEFRTAVAQTPEAVAMIAGLYMQLLGRGVTPDELGWAEMSELAQGVSKDAFRLIIAHCPEAQQDFDAAWYLAAYPDVAASGGDPYLHYIYYGWKEGRNPSASFDTNYYLSQNADVAAAGINPLLHYRLSGWREGRNPSATFNTSAYLAANPDVAAAGIDPLQHYVTYGQFEHRLVAAAPRDPALTMQALAIDTFYLQMFARPATMQERGTIELAARSQPIDQVLAALRANPGFQATQTAVINAFYQQHWQRDATAGELANIKGATAAGQSLLDIEKILHPDSTPASTTPPQDQATVTANALYQQLFGRNAFAPEVRTIRDALAAGQTPQQIHDYLATGFIYSSFEDGLLRSIYTQVAGPNVDEDAIAEAKAELHAGAWLDDIRYEFAHSGAVAIGVDETFRDVLGRSASDVELAIWEDELSDTGTVGGMRVDLAQHHAGGKIDQIYHDVLGRAATGAELAGRENELIAGKTLGDVRFEVAHSSEAGTAVNAAVLGNAGVGTDATSLAEIEAGLAAGATLDSLTTRFAGAVQFAPQYDTNNNVIGGQNVLDPFLLKRAVASGFYATMLGRPPSLDEVAGIEAAFSTTFSPMTELTVLDLKGKVLGYATADKLLTQLPVFVTLNHGATPTLQWPGGTLLPDGAQVAAFLLGIEARAGRLDQKTLAIYNDVSAWLDQVGQQLLQLAATMSQTLSVETNSDRRIIESEIIKLAVQLAAMPPSVRAAAQGITERLSLHGHQADLSLFTDPLTGQWNFKVHDIDTTDWFRIIVEAVVLVATVVLVVISWGSATPLLFIEAGALTTAGIAGAVSIVGSLALAGESFANGDVLSGLLSLASATGVAFQGNLLQFANAAQSAQIGGIILAARGVIGGIAASVQAAEAGNTLGLVSGMLSVAASAASGAVAIQGNSASATLKDVGLFLAGVSTATSIADAYHRGDIQGGLMASIQGLLTAYSIASRVTPTNVALPTYDSEAV